MLHRQALKLTFGRLRTIGLAGVLTAAFFGHGLAAETVQIQTLFDTQEELRLVLEAPMSTLKAKRKSYPEVEGVLYYYDAEGGEHALDVKVSTRGKSRLKICTFPPLRLNFKKKQIKGTAFEGHEKLKMVTHCGSNRTNRSYVRQEFLIYQALQRLTEKAYRARFVNMEYRDTDGKGKSSKEPAFLLENPGSLERRTGLVRVRRTQVQLAQIDESYLSLVSLFQYMIGNTDWSVRAGNQGGDCCHNGHVYGPEGVGNGWFVVPYDFDYSGLINAYYALPSESAPVDSVRERFYRGFCSNNDQLPSTIAHFNKVRLDLEASLSPDSLKKSLRKQNLSYLDQFYKTIKKEKNVEKRIIKTCKPL